NIYTDSAAAIQATNKSKKGKARKWLKSNNPAILKAIRLIVETKGISLILHKIKAHIGIKENEIADAEAKKGTQEYKLVRVQQTQIQNAVFSTLWRDIEIERPIRKFIKKLNNSIVKSEWTFIRGGKDKIHSNRKENMSWSLFSGLVNKLRKKQGNSLKENSRWIFTIKCINRLLPTLEKRYLFRPELYENSICQRCRREEETFEHLLRCISDKEKWKNLEKKVLEKLDKPFHATKLSEVQ